MSLLLVDVVGPISIAMLLVYSMRSGGWRGLWVVAILMGIALLLFSRLIPEIVFYRYGRLAGAGCHTRPFPFAPFAAAAVVQGLAVMRIPSWVGAVVASVVGWCVFQFEGWIS